jgi:predicted small metal-binding protein
MSFFEEHCGFQGCNTVIAASNIREGFEALRNHWKSVHNFDPATIGQQTVQEKN